MSMNVSIIVPVYKVEKYLPVCVESILRQTYTDYELILVDDGSPDQCPQLCDGYANQYKHIRVIHKKNGGLSDARNAGLKVAAGQYITFIDSDDYVHPLYLEALIKAVLNTDADISLVNFKSVYKFTSVEQHIDESSLCIKVYDSTECLIQILHQRFHDVSACGILIPVQIAKRNLFPKGKLYEDLYTTYKYYYSSTKIAVIKTSLYYYVQRAESIMNATDRRWTDIIEASNIVVEACSKNKKLKIAALDKKFSNYCRVLLTIPELESKYPNSYKDIVSFVRTRKFYVLLDKNSRIKNRIAAFSLLFGISGLTVMNKLKFFVSSVFKRKMNFPDT